MVTPSIAAWGFTILIYVVFVVVATTMIEEWGAQPPVSQGLGLLWPLTIALLVIGWVLVALYGFGLFIYRIPSVFKSKLPKATARKVDE